MDQVRVHSRWRALAGRRSVRVAVATAVAAPLYVVGVLAPAWAATSDPGGYEAPPVPTRVVRPPDPTPTPTPDPTPSSAAVVRAAPKPTPSPEPVLVAAPAPAPAPDPVEPAPILRDALPAFIDVVTDVHGLVLGGASALLWIALVALPGSLLESSIEKRTGRGMGKALATVSSALNGAVDRVSHLARWTLAGPLAVALLAATAFGFADPHLAWDGRSLSTVLALFVALTVITIGSSQVASLVVRRLWGIHASVKAEPLGLLAAIAGVAVGRFLALSPGLFLGLVVGVEAGHNPTQQQKGRAVIARSLVLFTFAIVAWLVYSFFFAGGGEHVAAAAGEHGGEAAVVAEPWLSGFVSDALSAVTIEGMMYIVTALLPISPLPGRDLFAYSKKLWVGLYAVFAVGFAVVALPGVIGHAQHAAEALGRQALVMLVFSAVAVGSWLHARRSRMPRAPLPA